jgi:FAD/FMN-containing dehydrogenase
LTTEQVSQIVKTANQSGVSVVPIGSGSKKGGGGVLSSADVVLSLKNMKRIVELDLGNSSVRVEAGMANGELQKVLAGHKLCFPLDPLFEETSTIGGELATNASGPGRFTYGTARDLVLGLTAVSPTGDIIHAGGKTMKNVAGLDICKMFINSWGTLGIITEATLRLFPLPEVTKTLSITFADLENAMRLVKQLMDSKLTPAAIDLVDGMADTYMHSELGTALKEKEIMLLIKVEGSSEVVERHLKEIRGMSAAGRAVIQVVEAKNGENVWQAYSSIHKKFFTAVPGGMKGKAAVPIARLADMYRAVKEINASSGITAHCGSGILYCYVNAAKGDAVKMTGDLRQAAERLGGIFTIEVAPLSLRKNINVWPRRDDYPLTQRIKKALDPNNILNPGKAVEVS